MAPIEMGLAPNHACGAAQQHAEKVNQSIINTYSCTLQYLFTDVRTLKDSSQDMDPEQSNDLQALTTALRGDRGITLPHALSPGKVFHAQWRYIDGSLYPPRVYRSSKICNESVSTSRIDSNLT
jgi:hypothetical protein